MEMPPVDAMLASFPSAISTTGQRLRALVREAVPPAIEVPGAFGASRPGRLALGYRMPVDRRRAPLFAWVLLETVHVHLGFEHGVLLTDPHRILEGQEFHRIRFVTYREPDELPRDGRLQALTIQAARVASWTREERLAHLLRPG